MPAPLGKVPTKRMPNIRVLGADDSPATRGALRFFRERRIVVRYVDLRRQPIAADELRRFIHILGSRVVLATAGGVGGVGGDGGDDDKDAGLADRMGDLARLRDNPRLLNLPLVRYGESVTAGLDETTWRAWLARSR